MQELERFNSNQSLLKQGYIRMPKSLRLHGTTDLIQNTHVGVLLANSQTGKRASPLEWTAGDLQGNRPNSYGISQTSEHLAIYNLYPTLKRCRNQKLEGLRSEPAQLSLLSVGLQLVVIMNWNTLHVGGVTRDIDHSGAIC